MAKSHVFIQYYSQVSDVNWKSLQVSVQFAVTDNSLNVDSGSVDGEVRVKCM